MAFDASTLAEQLGILLEAVPDATIVSDEDGRVILVNSQAEALFGFGRGELVGQPVEVLVPPRFRSAHPGHRRDYFRAPSNRPMGGARSELRGLRRDGTEFPAEISLCPIATGGGTFAVTAIRDVSARRRVEGRFRALLEAAPDAMVIADPGGRIALVNARAEQLFGYTREEMLGQPIESLIPARFHGAHRGHRSGYFRDPRVRPMGAGGLALFGLRKDGTEVPVEISLSPLESDEGMLAITAIRDVTERKRAEEERSRLHSELERLLADQKRFFTNLSHELRTPLSLILGPAERLLAEAVPADRPPLEAVVRNARTLLRHVNDLLDVAKIEAGRAEIALATADVSGLVRLVASHFEVLAAERRIAFAVEGPEGLSQALDAPKFQRILLNLLSNAFKFTPDGGTVRCTLRPAHGPDEPLGGLILEVCDSGPGIPREQRESVFLRFRQLDAEGHPGGTGLGLSIARDFALLHRGGIGVDEAPEGGARFRVVIPRLEAPPGLAPARLDASAEARSVAESLRPRPRAASAEAGGLPAVLVVEDNPEMAVYVRDVLAPQASVTVAGGGREALEVALALRPDLVVTDLAMAGGSGVELLRELRARPELDDVPVVILTARADDELRVNLLRQGAQDYLLKPFGADELRARTAGLLATRRARDLLRRELDSTSRDLESLARELAGRKRDLEAALDATRQARDEADRASRIKGDFLALVSHELRTPLAALHLQLDRLSRDPHPSERERTTVPRLTSAARRLNALVETLLEHSRIAAGGLSLRREPVDLGRLVEEAAWELRPVAEEKGIALRVDPLPDLAPLETDPAMLRVIVTNLLGNAVKFTPAGEVVVTVSGGPREQAVAISDTGPGIAEADRDRIFQPFEQLDPIRAKHLPGVGLGLALVREISSALGARVELRSQVGVGSTFTVSMPLPAAREPARPADGPAATL
jgi:PAS domain S-box-containing protein